MPTALTALRARLSTTAPWRVETLAALLALFWTLAGNRAFFTAMLDGRAPGEASSWGYALALGLAIWALHFIMLALVANRWTARPVLALLIVATAFAIHYIEHFHVYLDPSMLRNVLRTDVREASELFSWALAGHLLLYAGLPLLLLAFVRIQRRPWLRATVMRVAAMLGALALAVAALMTVFQPFSSQMRNHKELRYLITPANYLWSLGTVVAGELRGAARPRQAIGTDAAPGPSWAQAPRPRLVVLVLGETVRAANWGLNGYARATTPQLATLPVLNFPDVSSCGTNTETSVPCLFAPVGRRDYDEDRIRGSESLLHVVARAGVAVYWRDNQSGCKGVCEGLPQDSVIDLHPPGLCAEGRCLDEALLAGLDERLASARGSGLIVLHMLGNHGPSYFRRYPPAYARFQPACQRDDLRQCSREEIVNAYDNAVLYTDQVLARLIRHLQARQDRLDSAMIYVSDHGESLGENNLFLHGLPYAIAPDTQTRVPMVMWLSDGYAAQRAPDRACLQRRATRAASHDHLFHTLLGLLDVRTALYEPAWDLASDCRPAAAR